MDGAIEVSNICRSLKMDSGYDATVLRLIDRVALGEVKPEDMVSTVMAEAQLNEETAKKLVLALMPGRLIPLEKLIGNLAEVMRSCGGDPSTVVGVSRLDVAYKDLPRVPQPEPVSTELTPERFATETVDSFGLDWPDQVLRHRMELAVVAYVKGVRDRLETIQLLKRPVKVGGLQLEEAVAGQVMELVDKLRGEQDIIFEDRKTEQSAEAEKVADEVVQTAQVLMNEQKAVREEEPESPMEFPVGFLNATPAEQVPAGLEAVVEPSEKSFAHPVPSVVQHEVKDVSLTSSPLQNDEPKDEIAEEVARIAEVKKEIVSVSATSSEAEDVAKNVLFHAQVTLPEGEAQKRFVAAVDARLRDVRGAFETRALLEAPLEQNGVGISGMALANVMEGLEAAVTVRDRAAAGRLAQERDRQRQQKMAEEKGAAAHEQREASVMNKRYAEITGQAPSEHVEPVAPMATRASVAVPAADQLAARDQQIDTHKVLQAIRETQAPVAPPAVTPVLSAASIPTPEGRPKVQDIRFERKLAGPLEELRQLTLVDFRRLSKDPVQAATKIHDLVNLLSDQGYDRKIAAIQAWRESPVSQQYVHLSQEALLNGKSIHDVLKEHHNKGEETFSEAELRVVIDLNTTLRF